MPKIYPRMKGFHYWFTVDEWGKRERTKWLKKKGIKYRTKSADFGFDIFTKKRIRRVS